MSWTDLQQDLEERMCPNLAQIQRVERCFYLNDLQNVLVPILFLEKDYGIWTEDVQVVNVDHVFMSFTDADWRTQRDKLGKHCEKLMQGLGRKGTYGFINFHTDMAWAVFEEIGAQETECVVGDRDDMRLGWADEETTCTLIGGTEA